jgi:hypothetical protein
MNASPVEDPSRFLAADGLPLTFAACPIREPDGVAMMKSLDMMFEPTDVTELRAVYKGAETRIEVGYFDHAHRIDLVAAAEYHNRQHADIYVRLNPVEARAVNAAPNRLHLDAGKATVGTTTARRRWLMVELKVHHSTDAGVTEEQLDALRAWGVGVGKELRRLGWPRPIAAQGGNGFDLLYAIDLPNDTATNVLLKNALAGIASRVDDDNHFIGQSAFHPAQACRLYGTLAGTGDPGDPSQRRLTKIESLTARQLVTFEQLLEIGTHVPAQPTEPEVPRTAAQSKKPAGKGGPAQTGMDRRRKSDQKKRDAGLVRLHAWVHTDRPGELDRLVEMWNLADRSEAVDVAIRYLLKQSPSLTELEL